MVGGAAQCRSSRTSTSGVDCGRRVQPRHHCFEQPVLLCCRVGLQRRCELRRVIGQLGEEPDELVAVAPETVQQFGVARRLDVHP